MYTLRSKRREINHTRLISAMEQMQEINAPCQIIREGSEHPWEWEKRKVVSVDEETYVYVKYGKRGFGDKGIDEEQFVTAIHELIEKEAVA